ncbi:MAG: LamG domain-containing protein [bacterium]
MIERFSLKTASLVLGCMLCFATSVSATDPIRARLCRLAIQLNDGSCVIGSCNEQTLPFHTSFAKLDIALRNLLTLKPLEDKATVQMELANGDTLTAVPDFVSISLQTLFGPITIKMSLVTQIESFAGGVIRDNLVAEYLFSGNARDTSRNGCHGTVHDATLTEDRFGQKDSAYLFSGDGQWIDVKESVLTNSMKALTISLWARPDAAPDDFDMVLISKQPAGFCSINPSPTTDNHSGLFDFRLGRGILHFSSQISSGQSSEGLSAEFKSFELSRWFHFAVIANSVTRHIDFYVNGELVGSRTANQALMTFPALEPLRVGCRKDSPYRKSYFKGALDDIIIFDRALRPEEIRRLYRAEP